MPLLLQNLIVLAIVATAVGYVGFKTWRQFFSRKGAGCGGCGSCSASKTSEKSGPIEIVSLSSRPTSAANGQSKP
ncbi:MAG: FeoB-associated Cys-rich membrane protein [Planctomycetia bacterium]|nr:FeoB-associated Cys-rich membrane protein [Planctomycetia bacterium]